MSPKYQYFMENVLGEMLFFRCSEKHRQELFDAVETHPNLVLNVFRAADNHSFRTCAFLMEELENRNIEDNINLYQAMDQKYLYLRGMEHLVGRAEKIPHLNEETRKILINWHDEKNSFGLHKNYISDLLESGVLLNCDNLPSEWRKDVNLYAAKSDDLQKNWKNLDVKYMDKAFLSALFNRGGVDSLAFMKKKGKMSDRVPEYYAKVHQALMKAIEKSPKYDSENYGKKMTQNKRFENVVKEMMGKDYKIRPNSMLFDVYVQTAQTDIINGRANDLPTSAILLVLLFDKHNYYKREIPEDVLQQKHIKLPVKMQEFVELSHIDEMNPDALVDFAEAVSVSKILNQKEKDKVAKALENAIENQTSQTDVALLARMQEAKDKILHRKQQIQNLAQENMSVGDEKLEDVSSLTGEEKHMARAANKAKGKDKLAEKEKVAKTGKNALTAVRAKKLVDLKYQR